MACIQEHDWVTCYGLYPMLREDENCELVEVRLLLCLLVSILYLIKGMEMRCFHEQKQALEEQSHQILDFILGSIYFTSTFCRTADGFLCFYSYVSVK
jgi:hypothetical protein